LNVPEESVQQVVADEEYIPLQKHSVDLIVSNLALHWVNDLPGCFIQAANSLKPNGMLLASMFGGETLKELRDSFAVAELERESGMSHHVSPFARVTDVGNLLSGAGFRLPTSKSLQVTISIRVNRPQLTQRPLLSDILQPGCLCKSWG
jgi:NADH dehydrogenase [ubiquinone] 1 alpha subcomplex assembly factor 5